jgi:hypothetical protein
VQGTFQVFKQFAYVVIIQAGTVAHVLRLDAEGLLSLCGIGRLFGTESPPDQIVERLTKRNTSPLAKPASALQNIFIQGDGSSDAHDATIVAS